MKSEVICSSRRITASPYSLGRSCAARAVRLRIVGTPSGETLAAPADYSDDFLRAGLATSAAISGASNGRLFSVSPMDVEKRVPQMHLTP